MSKSPFYRTGVSKSPFLQELKGATKDKKSPQDKITPAKKNKPMDRMDRMELNPRSKVANSTDSLAVYLTRDARNMIDPTTSEPFVNADPTFESNWSEVGDAAEKEYGKLDLSNYKNKPSTRYNMAEGKRKYGIKNKK